VIPQQSIRAYGYVGAMAVIYVISRCYFANLVFDYQSIESHWQMLDIRWLQNDLLESLYYLHSQPPFYNLLIGLLAKLFAGHYLHVLAGLYLAMGLAIYWMLFGLLRFFGLPSWLAFLASTIYILSPEALLYEKWLFYTWFNLFLLVCAAFFLSSYYTQRQHGIWLALFFGALTLLMLTRSLFHLVYLPLVVFVLVVMDRASWRKILLWSIVPLVLVGGVYLKNYLLFGFFGGSSWLGMNLSKVASHATLDHPIGELMQMPYAQKSEQMSQALHALHAQGRIGPNLLVGDFKALDAYGLGGMPALPDRFGSVPALSQALKPNTYRNLNHYHYIAISEAMKRDAMTVISTYPMGYLKTMVFGAMNYIRPVWHYKFVEANAAKYPGWIGLYELGYLGGRLKDKYGLLAVMLVPLGIVLSLGYVCYMIGTGRRRQGVVALFMGVTILFVLGVGVMVEIGELNRMRVMTNPFIWILSVTAVYHLLANVLRIAKRSRIGAPDISLG
jgi:hypothetical protein